MISFWASRVSSPKFFITLRSRSFIFAKGFGRDVDPNQLGSEGEMTWSQTKLVWPKAIISRNPLEKPWKAWTSRVQIEPWGVLRRCLNKLFQNCCRIGAPWHWKRPLRCKWHLLRSRMVPLFRVSRHLFLSAMHAVAQAYGPMASWLISCVQDPTAQWFPNRGSLQCCPHFQDDRMTQNSAFPKWSCHLPSICF